jgi:hypothetical protein
MEGLPMFSGEFEDKIDGKGEVEKYLTVYPLAEWKKLAVCNFLVRMRCNGFSPERRQLDNKGRRSRSGRF